MTDLPQALADLERAERIFLVPESMTASDQEWLQEDIERELLESELEEGYDPEPSYPEEEEVAEGFLQASMRAKARAKELDEWLGWEL